MPSNCFLFRIIAAFLLFNVFLFSCNREKKSEKADTNSHALNSTFFSSAEVEWTETDSESDGDLWPSAWSDDNNLYAANGDGKGFGTMFDDLVVNKITGNPDDSAIYGEAIATGIGQVWGDTSLYNRKPTGMVSVNGVLYLAVQDLNKSQTPNIFNESPTATILRSPDKGHTWLWDTLHPMFDRHIFTTIMFLDYGKDGENNPYSDYAFIYGIDNNWRDSFSNIVKDPTSLYLARVPSDAIQNKNKWEFYMGDTNGHASWSPPGRLEMRKPVLVDKRRVYKDSVRTDGFSVISQGGIVYNKPLKRYIYSSWTEFTFEFYESPEPWGPWKLFLSQYFGPYPWNENKYGGYATVIPSKFISEDGTQMWVSSSTFAGEVNHYNFALRQLHVTVGESIVGK